MPRSTVIPVLAYPDVGQAIGWLCDAFGFTLRLRIASHRAQLNVGDGAVVVREQRGTEGPHSSGNAGLRPMRSEVGHSLMIRVEDVDVHYAHASQRGARVIQPPTDYPYGERQYSVADFAGYSWTFSQSVADVDPQEWGGTPGQL